MITRDNLAEQFNPDRVRVPSADILDAVARSHAVSRGGLVAPERTRDLVAARFAAMGALRVLTGQSLERVGRVLCRDHATVGRGLLVFVDRLNSDANVRAHFRALIAYLIGKAGAGPESPLPTPATLAGLAARPWRPVAGGSEAATAEPAAESVLPAAPAPLAARLPPPRFVGDGQDGMREECYQADRKLAALLEAAFRAEADNA